MRIRRGGLAGSLKALAGGHKLDGELPGCGGWAESGRVTDRTLRSGFGPSGTMVSSRTFLFCDHVGYLLHSRPGVTDADGTGKV